MAKQLYDYWFVQFDFPNEEGKPYKSSGGEMVWNEKLKRKIPNEWDNCKLKDFINLFDSKRIPLSSKDREERKGNYPYYGATGIMDYVNEYIFDGDYILLAEDGSTSDSKGFPIVQYIWGKNWVNNHAHIILPKNEQYLMFTYQMLRSIPAKQIETGSIQKKISQENLCEYNMVLPNSILIEKYESIISPLWEKRKLCIEEINALIKQRDELLPLLMNGQASVNSGFSGCYMASFRHNGIRYVAHIPTPNNSIKTSWNRAVKNRIIDNVVLFKPTEGLARIPGTIGIWGIITFNDRCYRLDVNENAPPSQAIRGQRIFNSIPRNPILTEIPSIAGGQMP